MPTIQRPTAHTPGRIVLGLLHDAGLVRLSADPVTATPQGYAEDMPDGTADVTARCVVTTTTPEPDGAYGYSGQTHLHYGYQVRVDASTDVAAFALLQLLVEWLAEMTNGAVTVGATSFLVYSSNLVSGPFRLGRTSGDLYSYTANFTSVIDQV